MPQDGSNNYQYPPGTRGVPDQTIESEAYNTFLDDLVVNDLNIPRPVHRGGTGADNANTAIFNLGGERAASAVANYDSHLWMAGSFYSAVGATGAPVAGHAFAGIAYSSDPIANPPANLNVVVEARDLNDTVKPGRLYIREKKAGVWGAWSTIDQALISMSGERAAQLVANYDTHVWMPGSFYSTTGAVNPPVAGHAFAGTAYLNEALVDPPTNANLTVEARDQNDTMVPGRLYIREKKANVWSTWKAETDIVVGQLPPTNVPDGTLHWDNDDGILYVLYNDGTSTQWVQAVAVPAIDTSGFLTDPDLVAGLATKVSKIGDEMTGDLKITAAVPALTLNKTANAITNKGDINHTFNNTARWKMSFGTGTESGSDSGSNLALTGYTDAGAEITPPAWFVERKTGLVTLRSDPTGPFHAATKQYVDAKVSQTISLEGAGPFDITVPPGSRAVKVWFSILPTSAALVTPYIRISVVPAVFIDTGYASAGFYSGSVGGLVLMSNAVQSGLLTGVGNANSLPFFADGIIALKRLDTGGYFTSNFHGVVLQEQTYESMLYTYIMPASALDILALRVVDTSGGGAWGAGSVMKLEWM